jgi:hypothetical protein
VVTKVAGDGSIRRGVLDTAARSDAGKWEELIEQAALAVPPPYRATPRSAVYVIHAGNRAVLVGEENLIGSLQELVTTILAAGDRALAAHAYRKLTRHPPMRACGQPARPPWA